MNFNRIAMMYVCVLAGALSFGARAFSYPGQVGSVWPLATCPVDGKPLGATAVIKIIDDPKDPAQNGREIRLCCAECAKTFDSDRSKYLKSADEQMVREQLLLYPSINCVVMPDESLSDPRGTIATAQETKPDAVPAKKIKDTGENIIVGNRLVRTCCGQCARRVRRDPTKWIAQVNKALMIEQGQTYPLKVCVISGATLPTEPVILFIGSRLVEVATTSDAAKAEADPIATLAKLDAAIAAVKHEPIQQPPIKSPALK